MVSHTSRRRVSAVLLVVVAALASTMCAAQSEKTDPPKKSASSDIAATVGDHTITLSEVDELGRTVNAKVYQDLYDTRRSTLDRMIAEYLLDQEAASRGITSEELIQQDVTDKVVSVSDDDVNNFFESNKAQMRGTLEQMQPQIAAYMNKQRNGEAFQALVNSLKSKQAVEIAIQPTRMDVKIAANDPRKGPDSAPVKIVEYSDFQ